MAVRTPAQLKAEFQNKDPQDFVNDLVDSSVAHVSAQLSSLFLVSFTGSSEAGACTATGVDVGDKILGVVGITDPGSASAKFEVMVTVKNQIQQVAEENLSAKNFVALVYRPE